MVCLKLKHTIRSCKYYNWRIFYYHDNLWNLLNFWNPWNLLTSWNLFRSRTKKPATVLLQEGKC
ncbi:MAG: hypothetical protein DI535_06145 [Citrobacter freundii]|nr:MAG: hypothetical protein DI535_06145 [Citrobacter freundii]